MNSLPAPKVCQNGAHADGDHQNRKVGERRCRDMGQNDFSGHSSKNKCKRADINYWVFNVCQRICATGPEKKAPRKIEDREQRQKYSQARR